MKAISYTSARLFSDCPARYKAERIDGISSPSSLPLEIGVFLHSVMHDYSDRLVKNGKDRDASWAMESFEKLWPTEKLPAVVRDECLNLAMTMASRISIRRNDVVGVEIELAIDQMGEPVAYVSQDAVVRGRLDRLEATNECGKIVLVAWDLKTGRSIENPANSVQLALYGALARKLLPNSDRVVGKLYYPRFDSERSAEISAGSMDAALQWAMRMRSGISDCESMGNWPATPGRGCRDCPVFWSCNDRRLLSGREGQVPQTEQAAAELLARAEVLTRELGETRELLKVWVENHGPVEAGNLVADLVPQRRYNWPIHKLLTALEASGKDFRKYVKGDTRKLKREMDASGTLGADLLRIVEDRTSTKLSVRDIGKEPAQFQEEEN